MCRRFPTVETGPGRCSAPRHEAAFIVAQGVGGRIVACGKPIDRSPSHERSTNRRRRAGRAHHAGVGVHRPDVPQRLRADAAERGGRGVFLPQDPRQSGAVVGADGADDAALRRGHRTPRGGGGGGPGAVRAVRAQGRPHQGVPARLRGHGGVAVHRQGAGEGAGGAHRAPGRPGARPVPVAGVVDGDGQPLLRVPRGRGLRAAVRQVLLVLPVQRQAVHQRPRVPQAPVGEAGRRVRGARQRRAELRRPGADAAPRRRPGRGEDRRPCATYVAGAPAAPVHGRRPQGRHPLRRLRPAYRSSPSPRSTTGPSRDGSSSSRSCARTSTWAAPTTCS